MFTIKVAGHLFNLEPQYDYTERLCAEYKESDPEAAKHAVATFAVTEAERNFENQDGGNWHPGYLEFRALHRKVCSYLFNHATTMLLHGVAVKKDGKCVIFTAPSGTGKTTHGRLWHRCYPGEVITLNGDTPFLRFGEEGEVTVYGSPWSGKEAWNCNDSAPLHAIVVLHQARENSIRRLSAAEAFPMLMEQAFRSSLYSPAQMRETMARVKQLCYLPVYSLGCNISDEAARLCHDTVLN